MQPWVLAIFIFLISSTYGFVVFKTYKDKRIIRIISGIIYLAVLYFIFNNITIES